MIGGAKVYDVTKYLNDHPGGPEIILEFAGKNADEMFEDIGHSNEARSKMKEFLVGTLKVKTESCDKFTIANLNKFFSHRLTPTPPPSQANLRRK